MHGFLFNFFFRFLFYLGRGCFGGFWSCDFNHDDVSENWIDLERGKVDSMRANLEMGDET